MRKSLVLFIGTLALLCSLSACSGEIIVSDVAKNVAYIANIRYTGYEDSTNAMLDSICTEELATELKEKLTEEYSRLCLIDITEIAENATHTDKDRGLDESIVTNDLGFFVDIHKVKFNYPDTSTKTLVVYDSSYELKKSDIVQCPSDFKGNINYKLDIQDYQYFKDGTLRVQLASSVKDNVLNNKQTIEVEVAKDGKIQAVNINDITCSLMYN